ncbi:hypothetical protein KHC33_04055 [Methanospirillum sp. J.3.6.1-F.2.7.3]|uniref:Uncharacterized protein n=1 Tax=Methanospirillum purgamenti TaxID=2834276 RepID=A0A8E7EI39_9EURY|nr:MULTISPECIES: hypothetical protein [Methanospirillum]MDX8551785.1 hypothetical protein [Methanospirillum hungatei]QVV89697.1 hypothetical protein KHC33_04055 [Methanospirillum sp. J.3.6.1-F.2.7.3]
MGSITIKATFDGTSFKIVEPIELEPNKEYLLTVEKNSTSNREHAIEFLIKNAGTIHGPVDFSDEHDHYLYGTPKKGNHQQ